MNEELLNHLRKITDEERVLLEEHSDIQKGIYTSGKEFVVDNAKLLERGHLIEIRPHTRFAHFPKHSHNYVELVYMCCGSTTHIIDGKKEIILNEGDLLFLNQAATQEILPIQNLIENMLWTLIDKKTGINTVNQITMGLIFMNLSVFSDAMLPDHADHYEQDLIVRILKYIETHYKDGTLAEISSEIRLPSYYVSRLLKKYTDHTFKELLQQQRLQQTVYLLKQTTLSIDSIMETVGYHNSSFFYRIFREKYGCSPKEYRAL